MSHSNQSHGFLIDLGKFLTFFNSIWVILTDFILVFPLANSLLKIIPIHYTQGVPPGSWSYLPQDLIAFLSTVVTVFVILWTFSQRRNFISNPVQWSSISSRAWFALAIGLLSLIIYLGLNTTLYHLAYEPLSINYGDPRAFIGDVVLLAFYVASFMLITRAFMLLGMREFFEQQ